MLATEPGPQIHLALQLTLPKFGVTTLCALRAFAPRCCTIGLRLTVQARHSATHLDAEVEAKSATGI